MKPLLTRITDLIKYDTPYLGPRITLMLSQLEFKLSVEKQYKEGIEKMARLYQLEGDRRSKADADSKRIESNQKIQLLKQALKRYEDLHVDMDNDATADGMHYAPTPRWDTANVLVRRQHKHPKYTTSPDRPPSIESLCCQRR